MEMKICNKCGPPAQPIESFAFKNSALGIRHAICKDCHKTYSRAHFHAKLPAYLKKAHKRHVRLTKLNDEFMIEYLSSHPCVNCGESDIVVLEFDHLRDKIADVSVLARGGYSLEALKREIDKCEVVCANCHSRRTARQFGTYRYRLR